MCGGEARTNIAQTTQWQHVVTIYWACRVDDDYVDLSLYSTVLEAVIHHNKVDLGVLLAYALDASYSIFAHYNHYVRVFEFYLQRLITHVAIWVIYAYLVVTLCRAAVATREYGDGIVVG